MGADRQAYIAGAFEHPTREAPDKTVQELHADVARGALADAGLTKNDIDAYYTAGEPDQGPVLLVDYMNLDVTTFGSTEVGGSSYVSHVGHAVNAIRNGKCDVALVTLAGRPRSQSQDTGTGVHGFDNFRSHFTSTYGETIIAKVAHDARRHMHEYGTTSEQLAEIREAAAYHAQFNENAMYQDPVTVEDVVESRIIADPIHMLDCCVISDGGGAVVVVSEDVRAELDRECAEVVGFGEHIETSNAGYTDILTQGGVESGEMAYAEAGVGPDDIDYASIYDAFTFFVLRSIEDLGFAEPGEGGKFVEDGALKAPDGELPYNTDGGSLCSNHPNRGGMTKIIEAVRQIRGEANEEVQVPDPEYTMAHGLGGGPGGHAAVTLIFGREDQ